MRTLLLTLHLSGVAAWLGANFTQLFLVRFFARQSGDARLAWVRATLSLGRAYYNAAGVLIGVTGVLLVLHGDWSWSSGFIWVGIAVLVIGGVLGAAGFIPTATRQAAALEAHDTATESKLGRRTLALAAVDTSLLVLAVLAMVHKWAT
jgi:hypothetical protein